MATQDDLRGELESVFDAAPAPDQEVQQPVVETTSETQAETEARQRDESGRFKAKEASVQDPAAQNAATEQTAATLETKPEEKQIDITRAPSSWKKETAELFATLPPDVQAEIHRRETDFHKGYGKQFEESPAYKQMAPLAEIGSKYETVAAPYKENFSKYGIDAPQAVKELFQMDHDLRNAPPAVKVQKALQLAAHYGIDLTQQFAPEVAQMQQRMYELEQQNKQYLEGQQTREMQAVTSEIQKFVEAPGHEHFDKVRMHMKALIDGGQANDLQDAYDQAVYANPETRKALLEQQTRAAEEKANAHRAKSAAVSVKGSSPASGMASQPKNSLRDEISAAFEQS